MDEKKPGLEWNKRLLLDIPIIDKQHERLIELTNDLLQTIDLTQENSNSAFLIEDAHKTLSYLYHHFATEEKMMLLFECDKYTSHKIEHESCLKEISSQLPAQGSNEDFSPEAFVNYFQSWLLSHITVHDRALADYIIGMIEYEKLLMIFPTTA